MILQTTLCLAASAIVVNLWLGMRIGKLRHALKVSVGDGGHELITRRMRAQANFGENTPVTLVLFALVEMAGPDHVWAHGSWLPIAGFIFIAGRVAHAFGMDSDTSFKPGRPIGMLTAYGVQLVLVVTALMIALARV